MWKKLIHWMISLDDYVLDLIKKNQNMSIPHFLIHSFLYYEMDSPIIMDSTFDKIVECLSKNWETIKHPHKDLIDRDMIKSGFYLKYPEIVKNSALSLMKFDPKSISPKPVISEKVEKMKPIEKNYILLEDVFG